MPDRLLVVIPALNEEESIGAVVNEVRDVLSCDVVVVDDGSTDKTSAKARFAGALVLPLPFNLGVGGAVRAGLRLAVERGYNKVVQMDGDGQHDPIDAKRLIEELDKGHDLVVGSRFEEGYELGFVRRVSMRALSSVVSRKLGTRITDTTSGFRAMGRRCAEVFAHHYPLEYLSDTVEALVLAAEARLSVTEVNVKMRRRQGGRPSSSNLRSTYHVLRLVLILVISSIRKPLYGGKKR